MEINAGWKASLTGLAVYFSRIIIIACASFFKLLTTAGKFLHKFKTGSGAGEKVKRIPFLVKEILSARREGILFLKLVLKKWK